jgi:hypothetical protein
MSVTQLTASSFVQELNDVIGSASLRIRQHVAVAGHSADNSQTSQVRIEHARAFAQQFADVVISITSSVTVSISRRQFECIFTQQRGQIRSRLTVL